MKTVTILLVFIILSTILIFTTSASESNESPVSFNVESVQLMYRKLDETSESSTSLNTAKYNDLIKMGERFGIYVSVDTGNLFKTIRNEIDTIGFNTFIKGSPVVLEPFTLQTEFKHYHPSQQQQLNKRNTDDTPVVVTKKTIQQQEKSTIQKFTQTTVSTIQTNGDPTVGGSGQVGERIPYSIVRFENIQVSDDSEHDSIIVENYYTSKVLSFDFNCGDIVDSFSFGISFSLVVSLRNQSEPLTYLSGETVYTVSDPVIVFCPSENPCVQGYCDKSNPGKCGYKFLNETTPCSLESNNNNNNKCIINSQCSNGICGGGVPKTCDDGNPCTKDSCDPETGGCTHEFSADNDVCSDGDPCTDDLCSEWGCIHTPHECALTSGNSLECSKPVCVPDPNNPSLPLCMDQPRRNDLPCFSVSGSGKRDECTNPIGVCNNGNCVDTPLICDDGFFCNGQEECTDEGVCTGGIPPSCEDGDLCTVDVCSPETDQCTHLPFISTDCIINEAIGLCRYGKSSCDPNTGSITCNSLPLNNTDPLDCARNFDPLCTGEFNNDECSREVCETDLDCEQQFIDTVHSEQCMRKFCDTELGLCSVELFTGPSCDSDSPCVTGKTCNAGVCMVTESSLGVSPCPSKPCMQTTCVVSETPNQEYTCLYTPKENSPCQSGDECNVSELCDDQGMCVGTSLYCPDTATNGCTETVCTGGTCHLVPNPNGTCTDHNPCTLNFCSNDGECISNPIEPPTLSDNQCKIFVCDPYSEQQQQIGDLFKQVNKPNGTLCISKPTDESCSSHGICISGECVPPSGRECSLITGRDDDLIGPGGVYYSSDCISKECNALTEQCEIVFDETQKRCFDSRYSPLEGNCAVGTGLCVSSPPDCSNLITEEQCQITMFDIESGECILINTTEECDDGDSCTEYDRCDTNGVCSGKPKVCEDGFFCNGQSQCVDGECVLLEGSVPNCPNELCKVGYCDERSRECRLKNPDYFGKPCGVSSLGICRMGSLECSNVTGDSICIGAVYPEPKDECTPDGSPNGIDENCNGVTDENCTYQCERPNDCPDFPCNRATCGIDGKCRYKPDTKESPCTINYPCDGPRKGRCSAGICVTNHTRECEDRSLGQCKSSLCVFNNNPQSKKGDNDDNDDDNNSNSIAKCRVYDINDATSCDDGDKCTFDDTCESGVCSGIPLECQDDGNQCTDSHCDSKTGKCVHTPRSGPCKTYDACNYNGLCDLETAECVPTSRVDCDDGNPCTEDQCIDVDSNPVCLYKPAISFPDDAPIKCHQGQDPCHPDGFCVPGTSICLLEEKEEIVPQRKEDQCIVKQCDPISGGFIEIKLSGNPCDDGLSCTEKDQCVFGKCQGTPKKASYTIDSRGRIVTSNGTKIYDRGCYQELCFEKSDIYPVGVPFIAEALGPCGLNDICTSSTCRDGRCVATETRASCNDGNYCNGQERCVGPKCVSVEPVRCLELDKNPCTIPTCSESLKGCIEVPLVTPNQRCGNSTVGQCRMGTLQCFSDASGKPIVSCVGAVYPSEKEVCNDGIDNNCNGVIDEGCGVNCVNDGDCPTIDCNRAICSQENICTYQPEDTGCSDKLHCTLNDRCDAGSCISDPYPQFDFENPCVRLTCIEEDSGRIIRSNVTQGFGNCTDGNLCTRGDTCDGLGNCRGTPVTCNQSNMRCDQETGECAVPKSVAPLAKRAFVRDCPDEEEEMDCEDFNDCTLDYFDKKQQKCLHVPLGFLLSHRGVPRDPKRCDPSDEILIPCDSHANLCLEQPYCHLGQCIQGKPLYRRNPNQCIETVCESCTGIVTQVPRVNQTCVTRNSCEINTLCDDQGDCVGELKDCDDQNVCTRDYCDEKRGGVCRNIPVPCGTKCDDVDGKICNCQEGECVCKPINCSNGIYCDGEEYWSNGRCVSGEPVQCDSLDQCSTSSCSESRKRCVSKPLPEIGKPCGHPTNGTCKAGVTRCEPQSGELYCYGYIGPEERDLCDGLDRNCDGYVDTHCPIHCEQDQDCIQNPQNPCLIPTCLYNNTCAQIEAPVGHVCEPQRKSLCVKEYQCNDIGHCSPFCRKQCIIPDLYHNQCVEATCCEKIGNCTMNFLNGSPCLYGQYQVGGNCNQGYCIPTKLCCNDHNECTDDIFDADSYPHCKNIPRVGADCTLGDPCMTDGMCTDLGKCQGVSRNELPRCEGGCMDDTEQLCSYSVCVPLKTKKPYSSQSSSSSKNKNWWFDHDDDDDDNDHHDDDDDDDHHPEKNYKCVTKYRPNGSSCSTEDVCSLNEKCRNGICVGTPKNCTSCNICTDESCNRITGECEVRFNNRTCPNADKCTKNSRCEYGSCSGVPVECKFSPRKYPHLDSQCVQMDCDPSKGCVMNFPHGDCDDGNDCTLHDHCDSGVCKGIPIDCDDGNPCNGKEYCRHGECKLGTPVLCDDGDSCTVSFCDRESGKCKHKPLSEIGKPCGPECSYRGECKPGKYACGKDCGLMCVGAKGPEPEKCGPFGLGDGLDQDCDGIIDNGCGINCNTDQDCDISSMCRNRGEDDIPEGFLQFAKGKISLCAQNGTCVYIDPECADPGGKGDPQKNDLKYWRSSSSKCANGEWRPSGQVNSATGKDIYQCQCKFGWTGDSCNECLLSPPQNSKLIYRCIKNRDRYAIIDNDDGKSINNNFIENENSFFNFHNDDDGHARGRDNSYELVLVNAEAIKDYERWFWSTSTSSASTSLSSSSSSSSSSSDSVVPITSLSSSRSSGGGGDDDDDGVFSVIDFFSNIFKSVSVNFSIITEEIFSSSSSSVSSDIQEITTASSNSSNDVVDDDDDSYRLSSKLYSSLIEQNSSEDDDDNNEREGRRNSKRPIYIVPGTHGLSCTCEIRGERPFYERDPFAPCNIKQVEVVRNPPDSSFGAGGIFSNSDFIHNSDQVVIFIAGIVVLLILLFLACCGCFYCFRNSSPGKRKSRSRSMR